MNIKHKILNRKYKHIKVFFKNELSKNEQEYLINKYSSNNIDEICYRELHNINNAPKCKYCNNDALFKNFSIGYRTYCKSTLCQYQNRKDKMLIHYGVENVFQLENVKEKCKQKHIENYGVDNPSKSDVIKKKKEETCLKHWGVTCSLKSKLVINKKKNTNLQKYGNTCSLHGIDQIKKKKQTWINNYGVDNPSKSDVIKKKKEETCLKHWGVTNFWKDQNNRKNFHTDISHQKEYETKRKNKSFNSSSSEKIILELLKNKFEKVEYQYKSNCYPFICDFYIPSLNLYIEYNEHWTHGKHPYNEYNKNDQLIVENWKEKNTKYYNNAIHTWTVRDVNKRNYAKQHKLNWIEFFNLNDIKEWINFEISYI